MKRDWRRFLTMAAALAAVAGAYTGLVPRQDAPSPVGAVLVAEDKGDIGDGTSPVKPIKKA
jgi:hypothetical protein